MTRSNNGRRQRQLGAIVFSDVVGCSFLMGQDEVATHVTTSEFIREFERRIDKFQGKILNVAGGAERGILQWESLNACAGPSPRRKSPPQNMALP